jgi:hypothetical protein
MVAEAAVATRVTSDPVTNPVSPRVPVDSPALKVVAGRAAVEGPLLNAAGRRRAVIGDVEGVDARNGRIAVEEDEMHWGLGPVAVGIPGSDVAT